ncbi:MAG: RsmB/NOP family class I SAM-dependent RNA methyltransferase [Candidatus Hodarchaeota archaeon]
MIDRYIQILGIEQTKQLLEANERSLIPSIRVNTLKIKTEKLIKRLINKGFKLQPIKYISNGFNVLNEPMNLGSLHEYLQGYYYLQNKASMLPAIILDPKPNEIVIDMCAAPGSKATHLAQLMENKGSLILIDLNKKRIPALEMNIRRLGVINSIIMNYDAINLPLLNIKADKILLDAPCTGEGLIMQDPTRKKSKNIKDVEKMAKIQKKLLKAGLYSLKNGGYLLYSTCSIAPEENEFVINDVLQNEREFSIIKLDLHYGENGLSEVFGKSLLKDLNMAKRLYPHLHNTIGFFMCLIQKHQ